MRAIGIMVPAVNHRVEMPKIVVFAGRGSSHSWTWFADFLERMGTCDVRFLGSREFIDSLAREPGTVVISGGDGYAVSNTLKGGGFVRLREYMERGGRYVGICAGAYLPLPSKLPPFSEFNISSTRIENIECSSKRNDDPPRVSVPYGACSILHPVRGKVEIKSGSSRTWAPLYGGPVFREPEDDEVVLRYSGFGEDTEFQVERGRAEAMVLGKPAAIHCRHGRGSLLLLGPHLEHPNYPDANAVLANLLGLNRGSLQAHDEPKKPSASLARSIADLKVAAMGLEGRSFLVGNKLWDASRFLELVKAIEKRAGSMDPNETELVQSNLDEVRNTLVKTEVGEESDVDDATVLLVESARICVDAHFRSASESR